MSPNKDQTFKEFVLDQLSGLGRVDARSMFGGYGLYNAGTFFAILFKGRLYFKTDEKTRPLYEGKGMKPFQPSAKQILKNYYEVAADVLEEADTLVQWARKAVEAG